MAVYIDPIVCHGWLGYLIIECWGIVPMVGIALTVALASAVGLRTVARVR